MRTTVGLGGGRGGRAVDPSAPCPALPCPALPCLALLPLGFVLSCAYLIMYHPSSCLLLLLLPLLHSVYVVFPSLSFRFPPPSSIKYLLPFPSLVFIIPHSPFVPSYHPTSFTPHYPSLALRSSSLLPLRHPPPSPMSPIRYYLLLHLLLCFIIH